MFEIIKSFVTRKELRKINSISDLKPTFDAHILILKSIKPYIKNKKLLDVGCWSGQFVAHLVKKAKKIYGIDPDIDAIKLAKINCPKANFSIGDARKLIFRNKSFDIVTFINVLEHIPKGTEQKCIFEINRVLKTGGYLFLDCPYSHVLSTYLDPMYWAFGHRHYSEVEISKYLTTARFNIEEVIIHGTMWRTIYFLISMVYKHLFNRKYEPSKFFKNKILNDFRPGGFMSIQVIAKKIN